MKALGLERGQRVAILSENRPEWAQADWASLCAGVTDVPIYDTLPAGPGGVHPERRRSPADLRLDADAADKILAIWPQVPSLERAVLFDGESSDARVMTLAALMEKGAAEEAAGRGADFRDRALEASP
jgi:long-chain acyl-CoA synthetase